MGRILVRGQGGERKAFSTATITVVVVDRYSLRGIGSASIVQANKRAVADGGDDDPTDTEEDRVYFRGTVRLSVVCSNTAGFSPSRICEPDLHLTASHSFGKIIDSAHERLSERCFFCRFHPTSLT